MPVLLRAWPQLDALEKDERARLRAHHADWQTDTVAGRDAWVAYVLRRLLRRSVRAMRLLGVDDPALPALLPVSRDAMAASYPEVETDFERISSVAYAEEDAFRRTLTAGTTILDTAVSTAKEDTSSSQCSWYALQRRSPGASSTAVTRRPAAAGRARRGGSGP